MYRTNMQSRIIEEHCVSNQLRYHIVGSSGKFYSRAEIQDCLCFFRLLNNGNDRQALIRAFQTPKGRGIGPVAQNEFFTYAQKEMLQNNNPDNIPLPTLIEILLKLPNTTKSGNENNILSNRSRNYLSSFATSFQHFMIKAQNQTLP